MKVIRLLIGVMTICIIYPGMAVTAENPNEKLETGSLRIIKIVMNEQCKGCHFNGVDVVKGPTR